MKESSYFFRRPARGFHSMLNRKVIREVKTSYKTICNRVNLRNNPSLFRNENDPYFNVAKTTWIVPYENHHFALVETAIEIELEIIAPYKEPTHVSPN